MNNNKMTVKRHKNRNILLIIIFLLSVFQYANTLNHDFAWDDKLVIESNPRVQKGIPGIPDLFKKHRSLEYYDKYGYRPITLTSFAIDVSLGGVNNPQFSHLINALLFGLLMIVVFVFLRKLFPQYAPFWALFVVVLYIAHPIHVEVVANIKSRDEILSMLFGISSATLLLHFIERRQVLYLGGTILLFFLALLSKENAIAFLGIYLIVFMLNVRKIQMKKVLPIFIPVLVVLTVSSWIIISQTSNVYPAQLVSHDKGYFQESYLIGNSFFYTNGIKDKIANAMLLLLLYLKNFILPYPLVFYYGYNMIPPTTLKDPIVYLSAAILITMFLIGIRSRKSRPELLAGAFIFLSTISIYLHLLRPLADTMADRFMFLPSLGLSILFIGLLGAVFKINWRESTSNSLKIFFNQHKIFCSICLVITIVLSTLTFKRNLVWKNDLTLVKHDLPFMENCFRAHYYYASLLNFEIREKPFRKNELGPLMVKHYKRSIEIYEDAHFSYVELGAYLTQEYKIDESIEVLEGGYKRFPNDADISFYLAQAYVLKERYNDAIPLLESSLVKSPQPSGSYYFLAFSYGKVKRYKEGLQLANEGMGKFPGEEPMFLDCISNMYFDMNLLDTAISYNLQMIDFGADPLDVYNRIIAKCKKAGNSFLAEKYIRMQNDLINQRNGI